MPLEGLKELQPPDAVAGTFNLGETFLLYAADLVIDGTVLDFFGNAWWRVSRAFFGSLFGLGPDVIFGGGWGYVRWFFLGQPAEDRGVFISDRNPATFEIGGVPAQPFQVAFDVLYPGNASFVGSTADALYILEVPGTTNFGLSPPPAWSLATEAAGPDRHNIGLVVQRRSLHEPR